jgi:predicted deacylase
VSADVLRIDLPEGPIEIPFVTVEGAAPGPHLTIIAGVHGTEYTSIAAARQFAATLDPDQLSGRVTVAPVVNPLAFWARSPFVVPTDGKNLNRSFPGDPNGTAAEVIAAELTRTFIEPTDFLIDLHAGDLPEALEPFALYDESPVEAASRELALAFGLPHIVRQTRSARTVGGTTSAVSADLGKPAITAESGQNGLLERPAVDRHIAGLIGVCRHLGIMNGSAPRPARVTEYEGWNWLRTPVAGWWEPAVAVGEDVPAGALIGVVSDVMGVSGARHEVRAPERGVPLFITTSPAVEADGLLIGIANFR